MSGSFAEPFNCPFSAFFVWLWTVLHEEQSQCLGSQHLVIVVMAMMIWFDQVNKSSKTLQVLHRSCQLWIRRQQCRMKIAPLWTRIPLNYIVIIYWHYCYIAPRAGSGVVRIDPLRFVAGCRKRRLNQALSVLSLSLGFFWCMYCAFIQGLLLGCVIFVICVSCHLVVLVRLSVSVQVTDRKDSSPKWPIMCWWGR